MWAELLGAAQALAPTPPAAKSPSQTSAIPMGPKPLDSALPREVSQLAEPELKALFCPAIYFTAADAAGLRRDPRSTGPPAGRVLCAALRTQRLHQSGEDRAGLHGVAGGSAAALAGACEHRGAHRGGPLLRTRTLLPVGKKTRADRGRLAPGLPGLADGAARRTDAALGGRHPGAGLGERLHPSGRDAHRPVRSGPPGAARESPLWAYRATAAPVWFDFQLNTSPKRPAQLLENYRGLLPTDGAAASAAIGREDGRLTQWGCWSHGRRCFVKAVEAGERDAEPYLQAINRLSLLERVARRFQLTLQNRQRLRQSNLQPTADALFADALTAAPWRRRKPASAKPSVTCSGKNLRCCADSAKPRRGSKIIWSTRRSVHSSPAPRTGCRSASPTPGLAWPTCSRSLKTAASPASIPKPTSSTASPACPINR